MTPEATATGGSWSQLRAMLPRGGLLPEQAWRQRHRLVTWLLVAHTLAIPALMHGAGLAPLRIAVLTAPIAVLAGLAALPFGSRAWRSLTGTVGLLTCSAVLVHISGGVTEAHFHLFVSLAIISLYQEWIPFVAAVAYVLLHHGVVGALDPASVYSHALAVEHPWRWAVIHAAFVAAACAAYVAQWRVHEDLRDDAQLLLESAGEGVLGIDLRGRVAFANPAAAGLLGRPQAHLVGQKATALLPGLELVRRPRHDEPRRVQEFECPLPNGDSLPLECVVTPSVRRGVLRGHVLTMRDLTERRRAEAERLQAQEEKVRQLREVDELKTQFLNTAAHELRTPLMPLSLQVEILKMRLARTERPEDVKALELLGRNFDRLQKLIEDILSVAKLDAGRVTLMRERVELARAVAEAHDTFRPVAEQRGIELRADCPAGVWLDADPLRLNQVLFNLVGNALRYTDGPGKVTVEAKVEGSEAVVHVHDSGRGLTPEQMERLFQPFGQVHDGVAAERAGTGLGLYITRALVELHGGRAWVHSDGPGRGATFS
ncbi:MAG TPA: PAS domain-containing sensor histidine kinase, partial [Candidatus Thermoplasmatota archaeon]|nr:PAS domain-containing sensor histidine kinase [Candidatus Thermoplasmatota archaeon]